MEMERPRCAYYTFVSPQKFSHIITCVLSMRIILLFAFLSLLPTRSFSQIYTQDFGGDDSPDLPIGWSKSPANASVDLSTASVSPSGGANLRANNNIGGSGAGAITFQIEGEINATGFKNIQASFEHRRTGAMPAIGMQYSINGVDWSPVPGFTTNANSTWSTINLSLPSNANNVSDLRLRWSYSAVGGGASAANYRIDNLIISGAPCAAAPSTQATNFSSSGITTDQMTINFTRGNGDRVVVLAKESAPVDSDPTDGLSYTANAQFGSGSEIGIGNFVVYDGIGNNVTVTGLAIGTTYYFAIYEYSSDCFTYKTPPLTSDATTPVQLAYFNIQSADINSISLIWKTLSEQSNQLFEIEHSVNGVEFKTFGRVNGAGNSNAERYYEYVHRAPAFGVNFYRLKQVDFNGDYSYSPIRSVRIAEPLSIRLFPSPAADRLTLQLDKPLSEDAVWAMFDQSGRLVQRGVFASHQLLPDFDLTTLSAGFYTLQVIAGRDSFVRKFQKQ
ncbi:MAG: T9SS type A sorting domain-containing protein [Saprospiraceae bacterium]|nr:T9SS type A sorting domain-containing protein [Saprospiraceae bacterium]